MWVVTFFVIIAEHPRIPLQLLIFGSDVLCALVLWFGFSFVFNSYPKIRQMFGRNFCVYIWQATLTSLTIQLLLFFSWWIFSSQPLVLQPFVQVEEEEDVLFCILVEFGGLFFFLSLPVWDFPDQCPSFSTLHASAVFGLCQLLRS